MSEINFETSEFDKKLEKAIEYRVNILTERYFTKATGGNNRNWAKRYQAMLERYKFIKSLPGFDEQYKLGYKHALDCFYEVDRLPNDNT